MRIVKLVGIGIQEFWKFENQITDDEIRDAWNDYDEREDYDSFKDYLEDHGLFNNGKAERLFVHEIYV